MFILIVSFLITQFGCSLSLDPEGWYISGRGSDTLSCGPSEEYPCYTVPWLVGRISTHSGASSQEIHIITDQYLYVDQAVMDMISVHNISSISMNLMNPVSDESPTMSISDVKWMSRFITWSIGNMDVAVVNSDLSNMQLIVNGGQSGSSSPQNSTMPNVTLENSAVGQLIGKHISLMATECNFIETVWPFPVFGLSNSKARFSECMFHKVVESDDDKANGAPKAKSNATTAIITGESSVILIRSTLFSENHGNIIHMKDSSQLEMVNSSLVKNNGQLASSISALNKSSVHIIQSSFTGNIYLNSVIFVQNDSHITMVESSFVKNSIIMEDKTPYGGAVTMAFNVTFNIIDSRFSENKALFGGCIRMLLNISGTIQNCTFQRNSAFQGAVINAQQEVNVSISHSEFENNSAFQITGPENNGFMPVGGAMLLMQNVSARLTNCTLQDNIAFQGGAISASNNVKVAMIQTQFINNKAAGKQNNDRTDIHNLFGGALLMEEKVSAKIEFCRFHGNSGNQGGALYSDNEVDIMLHQSEFVNNSATRYVEISELENIHQGNSGGLGGALLMVRNISVKIQNCLFQENHAHEGGSINAQRDVRISIFQSKFENNSAFRYMDIQNNKGSGGRGGAVLFSTNINASIHDSEYIHNKAGAGGAIFAVGNTRLHIENCSLTESMAKQGGAIRADRYVEIIVDNSIFHNNSVTGCDIMDDKCIAQMLKTNDMGTANDPIGLGAAIYVTNNGTLSINNSIFTHHPRSIITLLDNVTLLITSSLFESNGNELFKGSHITVNAEHCTILNSTFRWNELQIGNIFHMVGISRKNSIFEIFNCHFFNNSDQIMGSNHIVAVMDTDSIIISDSSFIGNSFDYIIYLLRSGIQIYGSEFRENKVRSGMLVKSQSQDKLLMYKFSKISIGHKNDYILIDNCLFENNIIDSKGVIQSMEARVIILHSRFVGNQGSQGTVLTSISGDVVISDSYFYQNKASVKGGVIIFLSSQDSIFLTTNSTFKENEAPMGAVLFALKSTNVAIESSLFIDNQGEKDNAIYLENCLSLRTAYTSFKTTSKRVGKSYIYIQSTPQINTTYRTHRTSYSIGGILVNSSKDKSLPSEIVAIATYSKTRFFLHEETPFATVTHAPCGNNCSCYHNQTAKANIYNCSEGGLTQLPAEIQNGTNWIVARHNSIKKLCQPIQFTEDVTRLNLSSNNIEELCPEFTSSLAQHKSLKYLDLSFNKLKYLPKNIQDAKHFTKILINHNDFICDCSMVWMIDWVSNFTLKTPGKEHVIQDYTNITCSNGVLAGKPIYELNRVDLGCFPDRMPSWEIGLLASAGIVVICVGVAVFVLLRRRNQVKYWLYKRFDILDKGCDGENLDGKEFDAFLSYSQYMGSAWQIEEFLVAHRKMVTTDKDFFIPILIEELGPQELAKHPELKHYIEGHTYIDARQLNDGNPPDPDKEIHDLRKRIRFVMPGTPLAQLVQGQQNQPGTPLAQLMQGQQNQQGAGAMGRRRNRARVQNKLVMKILKIT